MCRIICISGKIDYPSKVDMLCDFQLLAEHGKVPSGLESGHKDGWGIVAYEKDELSLFVKNHKNAFKDKAYLKTVEKLKNKKTDIVIGHLRKASVGAKNINNAHPFVIKNYSFCQNGTIFESENIPLEDRSKEVIKGGTDSERFFIYILQLLSKYEKQNSSSIRNVIKDAIIYMRKNFDYTAINMIFSDGEYIWSLREVNEKNKFVKEKKLLNYYTLFFGEGGGYDVISSEKLGGNKIKWMAMKNHELVQINVKSRMVKSYGI